jgi:hemerythrin-like domain-containing protein
MGTLTRPLREEHQALLPQIELLRTVADSTGEMPIDVYRDDLDAVYHFLTHELIPHAQAEERALYPAVENALGVPGTTATMSRDHEEVTLLTRELGVFRDHLIGVRASDAEVKALRRVLYGLYAILKLHFAKEEEVYLPLLDARLTPDEAHQMFEAMQMVTPAPSDIIKLDAARRLRRSSQNARDAGPPG